MDVGGDKWTSGNGKRGRGQEKKNGRKGEGKTGREKKEGGREITKILQNRPLDGVS